MEVQKSTKGMKTCLVLVRDPIMVADEQWREMNRVMTDH